MMELPENYKPKSFWEKKEGTTGMIFVALIVLAIAYGMYYFLPYIIILLKNTITAIALGAVLFAILWVLMDKRFRNLIAYMYKSLMRWITGLFITVDPIGILKNYVADLKANAANMDRQIANLRGQMRRLQEQMEANARAREESLKIAGIAQQQNKQDVFVLKARKAGRLHESNLTLRALYEKMAVLYKILQKMYEASLVLIEDIEDEVRVKEQERNAIRASYSAFKSAMRVMKGSDQKELFDQTMEYLADDYGRKLGEIEHFMDISRSIIETIDIKNGVYEAEALAQLEAWEKKTDSIIFGDQKQAVLEEAKDMLNLPEFKVADDTVEVPEADSKQSDKYETLFEDKEEEKKE